MTTRRPIEPWFAHEYPDRPLTQGALLCCCLLCAVSLERAGHTDAHRPIVFHTGHGRLAWPAQYVMWSRAETHLHERATVFGVPPGNWVDAVSVGYRHGRPAKGYDDEQPSPRALEEWPICSHCGPLSNATFATVTELGARRRRRSPRLLAADDASRRERERLVMAVEEMLHRRRVEWRQEQEREWRGLATVPDLGDGDHTDFDQPRW